LNYDRLAKVEVHTHLPGGGRQINRWIQDNGVRLRAYMDNDAFEFDDRRRRSRQLIAPDSGIAFVVVVRLSTAAWDNPVHNGTANSQRRVRIGGLR